MILVLAVLAILSLLSLATAIEQRWENRQISKELSRVRARAFMESEDHLTSGEIEEILDATETTDI